MLAAVVLGGTGLALVDFSLALLERAVPLVRQPVTLEGLAVAHLKVDLPLVGILISAGGRPTAFVRSLGAPVLGA